MQQIVHRQHRIVVNAQPATPAAQQQGFQLRSQHVSSNRQFQLQVIVNTILSHQV
jgi:hypothetical protein